MAIRKSISVPTPSKPIDEDFNPFIWETTGTPDTLTGEAIRATYDALHGKDSGTEYPNLTGQFLRLKSAQAFWDLLSSFNKAVESKPDNAPYLEDQQVVLCARMFIAGQLYAGLKQKAEAENANPIAAINSAPDVPLPESASKELPFEAWVSAPPRTKNGKVVQLPHYDYDMERPEDKDLFLWGGGYLNLSFAAAAALQNDDSENVHNDIWMGLARSPMFARLIQEHYRQGGQDSIPDLVTLCTHVYLAGQLTEEEKPKPSGQFEQRYNV